MTDTTQPPAASPRGRWTAILASLGDRAFGAGEYVGQECFMTASEVLSLGRAAGVGPGCRTLDLCCGAAGPGLWLASQTGCRLLGVDRDADGVRLAVARATEARLDHRASFLRGDVLHPPVRTGWDAVLLIETLLAFPDKAALLRVIAALLPPGGAFVTTLEAGRPLTGTERASMPKSDSVHIAPLATFISLMERHGLVIELADDQTAAHAQVAARLAAAFVCARPRIVAALGERFAQEAIRSHQLWAAWLGSGRVRKLGIVARRR